MSISSEGLGPWLPIFKFLLLHLGFGFYELTVEGARLELVRELAHVVFVRVVLLAVLRYVLGFLSHEDPLLDKLFVFRVVRKLELLQTVD